jgi:hypothetical protein
VSKKPTKKQLEARARAKRMRARARKSARSRTQQTSEADVSRIETQQEEKDRWHVVSAGEVQAAVKEWMNEAPPGAMWRDRETELSHGGTLIEIEELVPGGDPDKRRSFVIETNVARDTDFDVAASFAGEDRSYVAEVVEHLEGLSVRVFYDEREEAHLWGRNLIEELVETYRGRAFRVLMFVSKPYAEKAWPTLERRAALERAMEDINEPYILPVRLDDTVVPGLSTATAYIDARKKTPAEIADLAVDHLRNYGRKVAPPRREREDAYRVTIRASLEQVNDGDWVLSYRVHNGGSYPIHSAKVEIADPGSESPQVAGLAVVGTVAADEAIEGRAEHLRFTRPPYYGELTELASLSFVDRWGNHWEMHGADPVLIGEPGPDVMES